jgi:transposase
MVTLGVDAHKATHTVVAADENGRQVGTATVNANSAGHLVALRWAARFPQRRWALEDCRHLTRRFERELLAAAEAVVRVSPKLMAGARRGARTRGKSDPIDALAVARAALREPDLPVARLEGPSRELRLLVDHREDLVAERTRAQNRLRWHLHELDPKLVIPAGALDRYRILAGVEQRYAAAAGVVPELVVDLARRCAQLTRSINDLEVRIRRMVTPLAPGLLALRGCGALTAAKLIGETADIRRFRNRGAFAMFNGTAPVPVWSGNTTRHRLNRGGNRQLNAALHRILVTQIRADGPARTYLQRRMANGNTKTEAIRSLRRQLSDIVYQRLLEDSRAHHQPATELRSAA